MIRLLIASSLIILQFCEVPTEQYNNPLDRPSAPELISPETGTTITDTNQITLRWYPVDFATEYKVEISSDTSFIEPEFSEASKTDSIVVALLFDGQYYWRVRAMDSDNLWGGWSSVNHFYLYTASVPPFIRVYGGPGIEEGYSVYQTSDGGFVFLGSTDSYGAGKMDFWLVKTNSAGDEEWTRTYGGIQDDIGRSVQQTSDGGYILAGSTISSGAGSYDVLLVKADTNGDEEWSETFGGPSLEQGFSVKQTNDGGYVVAAITESYGSGGEDIWLIKTDINGVEEWNNTFGGAGVDQCNAVQQTGDGGYILTGSIYLSDVDIYKIMLLKTNAQGFEEWQKTFGGSDNGNDIGYAVEQSSDGGYVVFGHSDSYSEAGAIDALLIKTDANGSEERVRTFGGSGNDMAYAGKHTVDGGFIMVGTTLNPATFAYDIFLIKVDSHGNEIWSKTIGGSSTDVGNSVCQTNDGGYVIVGTTMGSYGAKGQDILMIRTDGRGNIIPQSVE